MDIQKLINDLDKLNMDALTENIKSNFLLYVSIFKDAEVYELLTKKKILMIMNKENLFFDNIYYLNNKLSDNNMIKLMDQLSSLFPLSFVLNQDKIYNVLNRLDEFVNKDKVIIQFFKILCNVGVSADSILKYLEENNITLREKNIILLINNIGTGFHLNNHLNYFMEKGYALFKIRDSITDVNLLKEINDIIDNNVDIIIQKIMSRRRLSIKDLKDEKIYDFLKIIIDELMENENAKYHDIIELKPGAYSNVYQIGTKVIKIGSKRETFEINNNKRFIKPLYRKYIYSKNGDEFLFCIEITEKVNTNDIDKEDVYKIYKEFRCDGCIWTDCREDNVGRLIKDNEIYFNGITNVSKNSTSYLNDNEEVLKAGEVVILDNDYIFTVDEFLKKFGKDAFSYLQGDAETFEERYQNEKDNSNIKRK